MSVDCLACGQPLSGSTGLCYSCQQKRIGITDVVDIDESVSERVERYFIISALRCTNCGDFHEVATANGETYTAEDFAIESKTEWELEMDKEEEWLRDNAYAVRAVLTDFELEWSHTVRAVRDRFFS
jgi:hypothetical protein